MVELDVAVGVVDEALSSKALRRAKHGPDGVRVFACAVLQRAPGLGAGGGAAAAVALCDSRLPG